MERLLKLDEAAELLGTSPRFPRRLIAQRRIRFVKVGRHVRIPESALGRVRRGRCRRARRARDRTARLMAKADGSGATSGQCANCPRVAGRRATWGWTAFAARLRAPSAPRRTPTRG